MKYGMNLYFESAAMIPTLITIGKMLEAMSKGRTTDALKGLMRLAPKTAVLLKDGVETEVGIEEVRTGDIFAVRPGEQIPVDGIILKGITAVNESALTGESIPVDKSEGRGGYHAGSDYPNGIRRSRDQSAAGENRRQGITCLCTGRDGTGGPDADRLADRRETVLFRDCPRDFGAGDQLSLRAGTGYSCGHNGR